jgi:hypothetical protein
MPKTSEERSLELLDDIKRLLMLSLRQQGVENRRIAEVLGIDAAVVSRTLTPPKKSKR